MDYLSDFISICNQNQENKIHEIDLSGEDSGKNEI